MLEYKTQEQRAVEYARVATQMAVTLEETTGGGGQRGGQAQQQQQRKKRREEAMRRELGRTVQQWNEALVSGGTWREERQEGVERSSSTVLIGEVGLTGALTL